MVERERGGGGWGTTTTHFATPTSLANITTTITHSTTLNSPFPCNMYCTLLYTTLPHIHLLYNYFPHHPNYLNLTEAQTFLKAHFTRLTLPPTLCPHLTLAPITSNQPDPHTQPRPYLHITKPHSHFLFHVYSSPPSLLPSYPSSFPSFLYSRRLGSFKIVCWGRWCRAWRQLSLPYLL